MSSSQYQANSKSEGMSMYLANLDNIDAESHLVRVRSKKYLDEIESHFGDKATMISDHSGIQVLKDHYVNDQQLVSASKDFSIFKK